MPPKQYQDAPPVPELPPSINLTLPFEEDLSASKSTPQPPTGNVNTSGEAPPASSPSAAAGLAKEVTQIYAAQEQQLRDLGISRAQALADARLLASQVTEIVQLTGAEIKQRGLANVGIFRPFRVGASTAVVDHLAELYLLSVDPQKYEGTLSVQPQPNRSATASTDSAGPSDLALATFGRPSPRKELTKQLAYAKIHDVADFLKWAFRRLKLNKADFGSIDDLTWYTKFLESEREQQYPKDAFSKLLLSSLPSPTAALLTQSFELFTTVSAHYVANAMPASRICKTFGFWIFGRISSDRPDADLTNFLSSWQRASRIMEHLLLAYLRDQSAKLHFMPTRLAQLIEDYPILAPCDTATNGQSPSLKGQNSDWRKALKVVMDSHNLIVSPASNPRSPADTLNAALAAKVSDGESSAEVDDWTALTGAVQKADKATVESPLVHSRELSQSSTSVLGIDAVSTVGARPTMDGDDSTDPAAQTAGYQALLREEDIRILSLVSADCEARRSLMNSQKKDPPATKAKSETFQPTVYRSIADLYSQSKLTTSHDHLHRTTTNGTTVIGGLTPLVEDDSSGHKSTTPTENDASPAQDHSSPTAKADGWNSFQTSGFGSPAADVSPQLQLGLNGSVIPAAVPRQSDTFSVISGVGIGNNSTSNNRVASGNATRNALRRATSFGTLSRRSGGSTGQTWGRNKRLATGDEFDAMIAGSSTNGRKTQPRFSISKVGTVEVDEVLACVWQDSVLDPNPAARLPTMLIVQLNPTASTNIMSLGGSSPSNSVSSSTKGGNGVSSNVFGLRSAKAVAGSWLVIEEVIHPPRAPLPRAGSTGRLNSRGKIPRIGISGGGGVSAADSEASTEEDMADVVSVEGRRSLFAPSLRSLRASIMRRASLRRMSSMVGIGGSTGRKQQDAPPAVQIHSHVGGSVAAPPSAAGTNLGLSDAPVSTTADGLLHPSMESKHIVTGESSTEGKPSRKSTQSHYTDASAGSTPSSSMR